MTQTVRQRTDSTRNLPAAILKGAAANLAIQALGKNLLLFITIISCANCFAQNFELCPLTIKDIQPLD
ncbi:MAG: hypothetical protein J6Z01_10635 [Bacteroidales bacterium]|nr:hypothetical protein [Bacteroidales bacterium]